MKYQKKKLLLLAKRVEMHKPLTPDESAYLLGFEKKPEIKGIEKVTTQLALPLSLAFGFIVTVFAVQFESFVATLPHWTNMTPEMLAGVDYLWDLLGEPVGKANVLYHFPNLMLYSFGIVGIKKLFDALDKKSWLDTVHAAQQTLKEKIADGTAPFNLNKGHSILFVGNGDFIGMQFVLNHTEDTAVTIAQSKPQYTTVWNMYSADTLYDDLKTILKRVDGQHAGEYIFFPVKDDQIFLPGPTAYDLAPHKLDILCQNIRTIEKEQKWKPKRIIIVGDKFHKSVVQSEEKNRVLKKTKDTITLASITQKYKKVTVLDPSDIVLRHIIAIADGRKIVFRATQEGIREYKERFYARLDELGYREDKRKKGILTIGYDLFEDQTEQQMLARKIDDYFPVVLSKNVHDALLLNGYKKKEFLYVPDLVLKALSRTASEQ